VTHHAPVLSFFAAGLAAALCASASGQAIEPDPHKLDLAGPAVTGEILRGPIRSWEWQFVDNPFDAEGITLQSWVPLSEFPGPPSMANDCWGYVSPSGREYAILGVRCGFGFVEVTDPNDPKVIGFIDSRCSTWKDVKVLGDRAYGVSDQRGWGIQVIDLSRLDEGIVSTVQNKQQGGHSTTHNIAVNPDSGYLYLVGGNVANGGLVAVDTSNPDDPVFAGSWGQMYVHDVQVVTYDSGPYAGREIAFCLGGFNNGWSNTGLRIVDVTDKSNMVLIGETTWSNAQYGHQGWLSEDRRYFYIGDELEEINNNVPTTIHVADVQDLTDPRIIGNFTNNLGSTTHNMYTLNGRLYSANYTSGMRVFDVQTDPANPVEVAYFDTHPENNDEGFDGAWSVFIYFPSGNILISDTVRGLFVVKEETCYPDCDGDGTLDFFDFLCFQNAFLANDPYADCDGDGVLDFFDFLCFQNEFLAGCQ
jgi:choice-of-anchor B domain-containing protein